MKLSLLLALLGAISARQLHEGTPEQEVPAEQGEEELGEPEPPCPMESESFRMIVPSTEGHTCHYVFKLCTRCYRGRLASIHSHSTNERLRCTAHAHTNWGQVWIGGVTSRWVSGVCTPAGSATVPGTTPTGLEGTPGAFGKCVLPCALQVITEEASAAKLACPLPAST
ncbi:unnamed protein product, partial [Natator depressus]